MMNLTFRQLLRFLITCKANRCCLIPFEHNENENSVSTIEVKQS
ncbi:hypothetical protein ENTCAN_08146 [Enterobacter cancerogenus ATCC 35316]|nr:hypothetical protein ENTCAN_08146 [Enterobacter cancerogenus ATCC 35316]